LFSFLIAARLGYQFYPTFVGESDFIFHYASSLRLEAALKAEVIASAEIADIQKKVAIAHPPKRWPVISIASILLKIIGPKKGDGRRIRFERVNPIKNTYVPDVAYLVNLNRFHTGLMSSFMIFAAGGIRYLIPKSTAMNGKNSKRALPIIS